MASLSSMQSDLRYWNNQVNEMNRKVKMLKKRRSDVDTIKTVFCRVVSDNSDDVNKKIRSTSQNLDSAIEHSGRERYLDQLFWGKNEQGIGIDVNLISAWSEMNREINDIDRQLNERQSSLSQAQNRVRNLKSNIAAEEKRQRDESRKKA